MTSGHPSKGIDQSVCTGINTPLDSFAMPEQRVEAKKTILDPVDRASEILFGLIMALTFTCSLSVAQAGEAEVRTMLIGALGCNLAWGVIDGVFYLMARLAERGEGLMTLRAVRQTTDRSKAGDLIAGALPAVVAQLLSPGEIDTIRARLQAAPEPPAAARLGRDEGVAASYVALLVFLSTIPVVLPFVLIHDAALALRVSNGIAMGLLFFAGYRLGQVSGRRPWLLGMVNVAVGAGMVSLCIALGG